MIRNVEREFQRSVMLKVAAWAQVLAASRGRRELHEATLTSNFCTACIGAQIQVVPTVVASRAKLHVVSATLVKIQADLLTRLCESVDVCLVPSTTTSVSNTPITTLPAMATARLFLGAGAPVDLFADCFVRAIFDLKGRETKLMYYSDPNLKRARMLHHSDPAGYVPSRLRNA